MKMIGAVISALAGVVVVAAADQVAPRMDRSKLLIGAYCFKEMVHDEAHVRDAKPTAPRWICWRSTGWAPSRACCRDGGAETAPTPA